MRVEGKPALSREVTIDAEGAFLYPRVGKVQAAGLTLPQLEKQMGRQLAKTSRGRPKVKTTVVKQRSESVNILGEVRIPRLHPMKPYATLIDVVSRAGGPTPHAGWIGLVMKNHNHTNGATPGHNGNAEPTIPIRFDLERLMARQHTGSTA